MKKIFWPVLLVLSVFFIFVVFSGCNTAPVTPKKPKKTTPPTEETITPLTPGTQITFGLITDTQVNISWGFPSGGDAPYFYKLVYSSQEETIDSLNKIETLNTGIITNWTNATSGSVSSLTPGNTYYFALVAKDNYGGRAFYSPKRVTLNQADAPVVNGEIYSSAITESTLTLSWSAASSDTGGLTYKVVMSVDGLDIDTAEKAANIDGDSVIRDFDTGLSVAVSGLTMATQYWFAVVVKDSAGRFALYPTTSITTVDSIPPVVDTGLQLTSPSQTGLSVLWGAATDNQTLTAELEYRLVKATTLDAIDSINEAEAITGNDLIMDWTADTKEAGISGLTPNTTYWFAVLVRDKAGNITLYPPKSVATLANELNPGTVPTGLVVYLNDGTQIAAGQSLPVDWVTARTTGSILLGGGIDVDTAMLRLIDDGDYGDVVVLRMDNPSDGGYTDYFSTELGVSVNSVTEVVFDQTNGNTLDGSDINALRALANQNFVKQLIMNAEVLFIAGGNQTKYYEVWNNTKVEEAIKYLIATKKVPIGGTSAGMHFLGLYVYAPKDAANSYLSLKNNLDADFAPDGLNGEIINDFFDVDTIPAFLSNTILDTHFSEQNRMGRLITLMARVVKHYGVSTTNIRGIACDERVALYIDAEGNGTVYSDDRVGFAYFVKGNGITPEVNANNQPLTWNGANNALLTYKIQGSSSPSTENSFNLSDWTPGDAASYNGFVQSGSYGCEETARTGAFKDEAETLILNNTFTDTVLDSYTKWMSIGNLTVGDQYQITLTMNGANVQYFYIKAPCKDSYAAPSDIYYGFGDYSDAQTEMTPNPDPDEYYWRPGSTGVTITFKPQDTSVYFAMFTGSSGSAGGYSILVERIGSGGDTTPPVWATAYPKQHTSYTYGVTGQINETGTVYWLAVPKDSTAPTAAQVKAQTTYSGITPIDKGSISATADTPFSGYLGSSVPSNIIYDIWVVAEDIEGNIQAAPTKVQAWKGDVTSPAWASGYPKIDSVEADKFLVKVNEAGSVYWIAVDDTATAPTPAQVKAGVSYSGVSVYDKGTITMTANIESSAFLIVPYGDFKVYMVAEDSVGNLNSTCQSVSITISGNYFDLTRGTRQDNLAIEAIGTTVWLRYTATATETLRFWVEDKYNFESTAKNWANDIYFYENQQAAPMTNITTSSTTYIISTTDSGYYYDDDQARSGMAPLYFSIPVVSGRTYYIKLYNNGSGSTGGTTRVKLGTANPTNWN